MNGCGRQRRRSDRLFTRPAAELAFAGREQHCPVALVESQPVKANAVAIESDQLSQRDLPLGSVANLVGNARGPAAFAILIPRLRRIQILIHQSLEPAHRHPDVHGNDAVLRLVATQPRYCRCTPGAWSPFLTALVSSMIPTVPRSSVGCSAAVAPRRCCNRFRASRCCQFVVVRGKFDSSLRQ